MPLISGWLPLKGHFGAERPPIEISFEDPTTPNTKRLILVFGLALLFGLMMLLEEAIEVFGFHHVEDHFVMEVIEIVVLVSLILCIAFAAFEGYRMWRYQKTLEFKIN